jgi:hypothetical protein
MGRPSLWTMPGTPGRRRGGFSRNKMTNRRAVGNRAIALRDPPSPILHTERKPRLQAQRNATAIAACIEYQQSNVAELLNVNCAIVRPPWRIWGTAQSEKRL